MKVRVATYNVRSFRAGVEAVASALSHENPSVLLLQECGTRPVLRRFAALVGMEVLSSHRRFHRVRNAVLYRGPWRALGMETKDLERQGRTQPRGLIAVELRSPEARLAVVSCHLGLAPGERERHGREVADYVVGLGGPAVVGADLNEGAEGPAARWIADRLFDVFAAAGEGAGETFPADVPTARIDFLFATSGIAIHRAWVASGYAAAVGSDHRPVLADLEVR